MDNNKAKAVFLDRDGTINVDKGYLFKISDFEFLPDAVEGLKLLQDAGYLLIIVTNQSGIARGYYSEEDFKRLNDWMLNTLQYKHTVHITASYYCPHLPPESLNPTVALEPTVSRVASVPAASTVPTIGERKERKEREEQEETRTVIPEHLQKYRIHCNCRKPALGLFNKAIKDYEIDLSSSYAIGDKLRDLAICENTKCKGFLITNDKSDKTNKNDKTDVNDANDKNNKENTGTYTAVSSLLEAARLIIGGSK